MKNNKGRAISPGYAAVYLILILWSLTTIFPLAWSVMNSFKDKKMIYSNSFALRSWMLLRRVMRILK